MGRKVEKTRNAGTWTEARYWSAVRSCLRRGFRHWKPATEAKINARRANQSENKRLKWEYLCANCKEWWADRDIQVDHITPVGSLRRLEDLSGFVERLTPEEGFQVLCKKCHKEKTNNERVQRDTREI